MLIDSSMPWAAKRWSDLGLQTLPAPCSTCVIAEQDAPYVVVDANNVDAFCGEDPDCFGSDQTCRARYQYDAHPLPLREACEHRLDASNISWSTVSTGRDGDPSIACVTVLASVNRKPDESKRQCGVAPLSLCRIPGSYSARSAGQGLLLRSNDTIGRRPIRRNPRYFCTAYGSPLTRGK